MTFKHRSSHPYQGEAIRCEPCGKIVGKNHIARHNLSRQHLDALGRHDSDVAATVFFQRISPRHLRGAERLLYLVARDNVT